MHATLIMRRISRGLAAGTLMTVGVAGGCYEETAPAPQAQSAQPPAPPQEPQPGTPSPGSYDEPAPSYSGARGAAQRTADRIGERQQELEEALDEE